MKISTDSWHFKWIATHWIVMPRALCWYCQKLMISMALYLGAGLLLTICGLFVLVTLTIPFWQWFFPEFGDGLASILSFLGWFAIGIFCSYQYRQYLYYSGGLTRKMPVHKEQGIVSLYIHAKHRKICPLLTYE